MMLDDAQKCSNYFGAPNCYFQGITFFLPEVSFTYFKQMHIQSIVWKLEFFFLPVFWIMMDNDVWNFTKKSIRSKFIALKLKIIGD